MKLGIYGAKSVGKSTLVNSLIIPKKPYSDSYNNQSIAKIKGRRFDIYEYHSEKELLDDLYKLDILLLVSDNTINWDQNTINNLFSQIKLLNQNYDKNTSVVFCVTKCDLDDYSIDEDSILQLNEDTTNKLNAVKEEIQKLANKYAISEESCNEFINIMGEQCYVIRGLLNNSEIEVELMEKFGLLEFGKAKWKKFNSGIKKMQIMNYIKTSLTKEKDYNERMNNYGYNSLLTSISSACDWLLEHKTFMSSKLKATEYYLSNLSINNLQQFLQYYNETIACSIVCDDNINKNICTKIYEIFTTSYALENITTDTIQKYEQLQHEITEFQKFKYGFNSTEMDLFVNSLVKELNNYYMSHIMKCDIKEIGELVKKLNNNKYENMDNFFKNFINEKFSNSNWINYPTQIVSLLEQFKTDQIMTSSNIINLLFTFLEDRLRYYASISIEGTDQINLLTVHMSEFILNNLECPDDYDFRMINVRIMTSNTINLMTQYQRTSKPIELSKEQYDERDKLLAIEMFLSRLFKQYTIEKKLDENRENIANSCSNGTESEEEEVEVEEVEVEEVEDEEVIVKEKVASKKTVVAKKITKN
jgi:GTPase SAR1 family protein